MHKISPVQYFRENDQIAMAQHRLPHWDQVQVCCFVTWRLFDSIPERNLKNWMNEKAVWLKLNPKPWSDAVAVEFNRKFQGKIEKWLDHGYGSCVLTDPQVADVVEQAFHHFESERYQLYRYVIMPNHVHLLFQPMREHTIASIVKSWKSFTARTINHAFGRSGALWQEDYWDRLVRDAKHFYRCEQYIESNPAKAKLKSSEYRLFRRAGL